MSLNPKAPRLPDLLAVLYKPILPLLKKIEFTRTGYDRQFNPQDVLVPEGFTVELVAQGFNAPVHCCFDDEGNCYISESGHKIDSVPRIVKVDLATGEHTTFFELPEDRWVKTGALTGACWHEGSLYVMNTHELLRVNADGSFEVIVSDLAGFGDHQSNHPVVGPDGKLYFGQGSATNTGVVGADNFAYEWLSKFPDFCDVPARDLVLTGRNYPYQNLLGDVTEEVLCGAFVAFGESTQPGQVIEGRTKCTGAILRCNPDGSDLEVVAWGLRNPYGIAFHPDGRLFATEHGMDERGQRFVVDDLDDFYEIVQDEWYGWPDFASGYRLDDPFWGERGKGREPVLAEFPNPDPPKPFLSFERHTGANGVCFSHSAGFGFEGDAFVALFGDIAPITTPRLMTPAGYKVVRIDMRNHQLVDFAVNKIAGPASKLPHRGFERPSHCEFGPDGALYVVDWGAVKIAPERGGIRMPLGNGALWRIRRTGATHGEVPTSPTVVPLYAILWAALLGGIAAVISVLIWLLRWIFKG